MQLTWEKMTELSRNSLLVGKHLSLFENLILSTVLSMKLQLVLKIKYFTLSGTLRSETGGIIILCTFYMSNL